MPDFLIKTGLILLIIYLIYLSLIYLAQRSLLYPGQTIAASEYKTHWIKPDQIYWLDTPFGKTEAWYIESSTPNQTGNRPVVIMAHGNYELIDFCQPEARGFNQIGADVLLVEFPGYGRSNGETTQESITAAFISAYDWLIGSRNRKPEQIIGYGRSLGGGAICALASERYLQALILQSTFTSVRSFSGRFLTPAFFVKDPFDNLSVIRNFSRPVLIFHGKQDAVIPFNHGEQLAKVSPLARFIGYDCDHNDCPPDWEMHWQAISEFIEGVSAQIK